MKKGQPQTPESRLKTRQAMLRYWSSPQSQYRWNPNRGNGSMADLFRMFSELIQAEKEKEK